MKRIIVMMMIVLLPFCRAASGGGGAPLAVGFELATFAGGCFWCMEPPFAALPGVIQVTSGYTGGKLANPTYEQVSSGNTGHVESVQIRFDPKRITYQKLLEVFWRSQDPTDADGQFVDRGSQYRSEIFYHSAEQKQLAEISKANLEKSGRFGKKIVTEIRPAGPFYAAEDYHQHYYQKSPIQYKLYRLGSGRESFLKKTWGK